MPAYEYKALDRNKKSVKGVIEAESSKIARSKLKKQGLFLTDLSEQKGGVAQGSGINIQIDFSRFFQRVSASDLAEMTSQLATLISAGIPMVEALSALVDQTENQALKVILVKIREQVNQGKPLGDSLKQHPKVFNNLYVSMVSAGEQSGALDVVLKRLTEYTEATVKLRGELIGALTYPALMGLISLGVVAGLFIAVIPRVRRIFDSFDATLPLITRVMLGLSDFLTGYWFIIIAAIGGGIWWMRRWVQTEAGRRKWDRFMLTMPVFGRINRLVACLLYTSPSPRDGTKSRMPSSA